MSTDMNSRDVDRGGRNRKKKTSFQRKAFVSTHVDPAMKDATFDAGDVRDARQYVKSMETIVTYIGRSGKEHPIQLRQILIGNIDALPAIPEPARPTPDAIAADDLVARIYIEDRKSAIRKQEKLTLEIGSLYDELWEQCSKELRARIQGEDGYTEMMMGRNPLILRNKIKRMCCGFDDHKMKFYALSQAVKRMTMFYQRPGMTNEEYKKQFDALWDTVKQFGGSLGNHPTLINARAAELAEEANRLNAAGAPEANADDIAAATQEVENRMKACFMLGGANNERFSSLKNHLENQYIMGEDQYPSDSESLLGILNNFRVNENVKDRAMLKRDTTDDGVAFVQEGLKELQKDDGAVFVQESTRKVWKKEDITAPGYRHKEKRCYHCDQVGHIARDCPKMDPADMGNINFQFGFGALQRAESSLKENHLYLDTCSTDDFMCNPSYLTGVHKSSKALRLHTNAGSSTTDKKGYLGSTLFWLGQGCANVIKIKTLEEICHKNNGSLSYHSKRDKGSFIAHLGGDKIVTFRRCPVTNFPFIDLDEQDDQAVMLLQSVSKNMEGFTKKEVQRAMQAYDAQAAMGYVSEEDLRNEVSGILRSSNISRDDIANAKHLFGPNHHIKRGKERRMKPIRVEPDYCSVPASIMERHKNLTLVGDVMFVCGLPFLITLSRGVRFATVQYRPHRTGKLLSNALYETIKLYKRAGFKVQTCLMDNEFNPLKALLSDICTVNTAAKGEHVGEIERFIQTIKGKCRCISSEMREVGITHLPVAIIKAMVGFVVMWQNALRSKSGISKEHSPRELVLRWQLDYKKHMKTRFGAYCEVAEHADITNTQRARTTPAVCLGPTGNMQGTYKFFNLLTGHVVKRRSFTVLPYPSRMIRLVNEWGKKSNKNNDLIFKNRKNEDFAWDDDDEDLINDNAEEPPSSPFPDIPAEMPGVEVDHEQGTNAIEEPPAPSEEEELAASVDNANFGPQHDVESESEPPTRHAMGNVVYNINVDVANTHQDTYDVVHESEVIHDPDEAEESTEENVPTQNTYVTRSGRRSNPPDRLIDGQTHLISSDKITRRQIHMNQDKKTEDVLAPIAISNEDEEIFGVILEQISLKKGIKEFGYERANESIMKEFQQLHDQNCWKPRDPSTLSREEKRNALSTVVFMKQKRDGRIKTRSCVNGSPQRDYIKKEDATSPTVGIDNVFTTGAINAHEGRDVMTFDIPGAFITTKTDEYVIMTLRGQLCEIMTRIDPKLYRRYITKDKRGNPVLYVQLYKSLYGLLRSALLFYKKFRRELEDYGFVVNPFDPCVFNKRTADGEQHTIIFHVDDGLASHKNPVENTKLLVYLNRIYGDGVTFKRGKKLTYLGMDMDYTEKGALYVSMLPYIDSILEDFSETIENTSPTPAAEHLFKVRENGNLLDEDQAIIFHKTVAQLLFLCMRARRDIQTAVSFLTTRVKNPDEDDWGKVKRVLKYLKGTKSLRLHLTIDNLHCTKWFVDSSHGVHWDCKGHTGAAMTMGDGAIISISRKHKTNAGSSTEAELIGVDDALPKILYSLEFIRAQGYRVKHALLYQDNKSAILLELHGKLSSGKRTKHIKMKFFYIRDKVEQGDVIIKHKNTEDMWCDILTKPKQGKSFRIDRSKLMGCDVDWDEQNIAPQIQLDTDEQNIAPQIQLEA